MRTIGLKRTAERIVKEIESDAMECVAAYCEGINSYLESGSLRLPAELIVLGGRPERWTPVTCLTVGLFETWLLDAFWPADLVHESLIRKLGLERPTEILLGTASYNNPPAKVDGPGYQADTLGLLEKIDWDFESEGGGGEWLKRYAASVLSSNNWVLSGRRTESESP